MLSSAPDDPTVAPSATDTAPVAETALDRAVVSGDVAAFRAAKRAEQSGKPLDVAADPSPADATADPSPAADVKPRVDRRATEHRVPELLADRANWRTRAEQAERELAALKQPPPTDAKQADSSQAAGVEDFPEFDAWLAKPENEGKSYTQYQRALIRFEYDQAQAESSRKAAQTTAEQESRERIAAYQKGAEAFVKDHDDYWTVVGPITSTPRSERTEVLGDVIQRSPNAPALLYELGTKPETWQRLLSIPERLAVYELGKIDAALSTPAKPTPQRLTHASEPPTILGRKAVEPANAIDAAVASGDVAQFRAARLKERLAGIGR